MKFELLKKLNDATTIKVQIEGKMSDCLRGANALLSFKGYCDKCGSKDVSLQTKMAKGFQFIEFVCQNPDCGARASWGQYKEGGYFLKNWEIYRQESQVQEDAPPPTDKDF